MNWKVTAQAAQDRLDHLDRIAQAGADDTGPEWVEWLGPPIVLWRKFRDGEETEEVLPEQLALWTLAAIPECEPMVERAKVTQQEPQQLALEVGA